MSKSWVPPKDIDKECVDICKAINLLPGVFTIESCCGHRKTPYWIFFRLDEESPQGLMFGLPMLLYSMRHFANDCHTSRWRVDVSTDCSGDVATFTLEGSKGLKGIKESKEIAKFLEGVLEDHLEEMREIDKEIEKEELEKFAQPTPLTGPVVSPAATSI
jgi:hypothetical protein